VAGLRDLSERCLDIFPALLIIQSTPDEFGDEGAPLPTTCPPIELGYQLVSQRDV
jgi:hypothetical protein